MASPILGAIIYGLWQVHNLSTSGTMAGYRCKLGLCPKLSFQSGLLLASVSSENL